MTHIDTVPIERGKLVRKNEPLFRHTCHFSKKEPLLYPRMPLEAADRAPFSFGSRNDIIYQQSGCDIEVFTTMTKRKRKPQDAIQHNDTPRSPSAWLLPTRNNIMRIPLIAPSSVTVTRNRLLQHQIIIRPLSRRISLASSSNSDLPSRIILGQGAAHWPSPNQDKHTGLLHLSSWNLLRFYFAIHKLFQNILCHYYSGLTPHSTPVLCLSGTLTWLAFQANEFVYGFRGLSCTFYLYPHCLQVLELIFCSYYRQKTSFRIHRLGDQVLSTLPDLQIFATSRMRTRDLIVISCYIDRRIKTKPQP